MLWKTLAVAMALVVGTPLAGHAGGFIFTADRATNPSNENETVRLLERLPTAQLKKRFSRYKVDVTAGEDCVICATVSRGKVSINVDYDETGIVIVGITSNDKTSTDALGNAVGSSLRNAIGATANCDAGDWTTCASPRLIGLHYVVEENEGCSLVVKENQTTEIPACARIGGFQIVKPHVGARSEGQSWKEPQEPFGCQRSGQEALPRRFGRVPGTSRTNLF
jgi:hypothetical protein